MESHLSNLNQLNSFADGLIAQLQPAQRTKLARAIARKLRASQAKRIAEQQNPDGSRYTPRKRQNRHKGRVRRRMFNKIKQRKHLKAKGKADVATVYFTPSVSRIARVHQEGLRDRVTKQSQIRVKYEERLLLGFSDQDQEMIQDTILEFLSA